jgi:Endoribonuclease L-PSP
MSRAAFFGLKPSATLLAVLFMALHGYTARGDEPRVSISGYDPVAYFTDGKPVQGKTEFEYLWHKLRWRFANGEHRDLFVNDPDRYTPQYDGYCAMGTSADDAAHKDSVDPEAWAIVDGKLYLTHNLDAGGATVKDIVFTVSYVTEPAEFDKYADLRQRYFGPPSPKSTTVPVPQLAGRDLLVQVEAFAAIK